MNATQSTSEIWKPVVGYEGRYEVSNRGNVRTVERWIPVKGRKNLRLIPQKKMSPFETKDGHLRLGLRDANGKRNKHWVHALVLEAFVSPRPAGKIALHKDGNPKNNSPENLRWGTHSENATDAVSHGVHWEANLTRCKRGHLLAEWNIEPNELKRHNKRMCRSCRYAHCLSQRKPEIKNNIKPWADARYMQHLASNGLKDPGFTPQSI